MPSLMSLMIFRFWTATVLTFFKKWLKVCLRIKHWKSYLIMEELEHKVGLRVAERIIIFEKHFN